MANLYFSSFNVIETLPLPLSNLDFSSKGERKNSYLQLLNGYGHVLTAEINIGHLHCSIQIRSIQQIPSWSSWMSRCALFRRFEISSGAMPCPVTTAKPVCSNPSESLHKTSGLNFRMCFFFPCGVWQSVKEFQFVWQETYKSSLNHLFLLCQLSGRTYLQMFFHFFSDVFWTTQAESFGRWNSACPSFRCARLRCPGLGWTATRDLSRICKRQDGCSMPFKVNTLYHFMPLKSFKQQLLNTVWLCQESLSVLLVFLGIRSCHRSWHGLCRHHLLDALHISWFSQLSLVALLRVQTWL